MLSSCCGLELPPEQSFPCTASSFFIQVELWLRTAVLPICNLNNLWYCTHFRSDPPPTDYALHQPEGSEGAGTTVCKASQGEDCCCFSSPLALFQSCGKSFYKDRVAALTISLQVPRGRWREIHRVPATTEHTHTGTTSLLHIYTQGHPFNVFSLSEHI